MPSRALDRIILPSEGSSPGSSGKAGDSGWTPSPTNSDWPRGSRAENAGQIDFVVNMSGYGMPHRLNGFKGGNTGWNVHDPNGEPLEIYRGVRGRIGIQANSSGITRIFILLVSY